MAFNPKEIQRLILEEKAREERLRSQNSSGDASQPAVVASDGTAGATDTGRPTGMGSLNTLQPAPPANTSFPAQESAPPSAVSMSAAAFVRLFKLCTSAAILLVGGFFMVKTAYPFLKELVEPGSVSTNSKDVPTGVKVLQQTRAVVAKNNAKVDYLDRIIESTTDGGDLKPLAAIGPEMPAIAPLPPQPVFSRPKPKPRIRLERLTGLIIDELHISGVMGGNEPRIMVNGILVGLGGIVDSKRQLRFESIDENRRVIVFGNGQETIEKRY